MTERNLKINLTKLKTNLHKTRTTSETATTGTPPGNASATPTDSPYYPQTLNPFERRDSIRRSPQESATHSLKDSDSESDIHPQAEPKKIAPGTNAQERDGKTGKITETEKPGRMTLEYLRKERKGLEDFLFNENNKISKNAIKFILSKWMTLEGKLQEEIIEREKLIFHLDHQKAAPRTYAQITEDQSLPEKRRREQSTIRNSYYTNNNKEVVLIKPEDGDKDGRTNEEIKEQLTNELKSVKKKLKIQGIKQMRRKGLIIELDSKEDINLLKKVDLSKKKLKLEEPKKTPPSIIIYDTENSLSGEEVCNDLINKNFEHLNEDELNRLKNETSIKYSYKTKTNSTNWVIQMPGTHASLIINKGRAYVQWRRYRVKEYVNVVRCFKCHLYGHTAKVCSAPDQICETCGSKEHLKKDCDKGAEPSCINCTRARRKDNKHSVRSKDCPEYLKHVRVYHNKVQWD
ncbi:uncharacterized protein LOC120359851 [Solenopsis invicta]|uniref:uncharacterized protein LOC120359851 n=1 Tax=Solenopsis invicta TaxID=13686 RepID=UPI00193D7654|nr:uncharacterized protein LOC120359851 [Solenopsis invicta]